MDKFLIMILSYHNTFFNASSQSAVDAIMCIPVHRLTHITSTTAQELALKWYCDGRVSYRSSIIILSLIKKSISDMVQI